MKKKQMKDLTLEEAADYCESHDCEECALTRICGKLPTNWIFPDKEVEVDGE